MKTNVIFLVNMQKIDISKLKIQINQWAKSLPYKCRIYLFGSYLKGTSSEDSDLDIAVEFLEPYDEFLWYDFSDEWQSSLTKNIGIKIQLEIYEGKRTPHLKKYLEEASMVIYDASL